MNKYRMLSALQVLGLMLVAGQAGAADPVADRIINNEGIGFSRLESGQIIAYDTVAAYNHQIVEADCSAHSVQYRGVTWCFANDENRQIFQTAANEDQSNYIPFDGGHCSLGLAFGNLTARGDPRTAVRIGNQLVLNGNFDVRARFLQDSERNMDMASLRFDMAVRDGSLRPNE
jgi:YHS domain-containing protein